MNRTQELIGLIDQFGAHNYRPLPIVLAKGQGSKVWDVDGKEYLDFLACYSALNFGHSHPDILKTLKEQSEKLSICSRAFYAEELCLFSKELAQFTGLDTVLPMNSGVEAIETALKVARRWGYEKKGIPADKAQIIAMENNFHGRTLAVISFSTEASYRKGFGPFIPGFSVVPFNDLSAVSKAIGPNTVAVLVEPIQAEAGILLPDERYLNGLRKICDEQNVLLILDEIQTGLGRTGKNFCFQHNQILPDILTLGKSLGGGVLPISATVARKGILDVIKPGEHGSTFGGNPLACAIARTALKILAQEKLADRATELGKIADSELKGIHSPLVKEVRGKGALIGVELTTDSGGARRFCEALAKEGVLCKETHDYTIRIAPPLTIDFNDFRHGLRALKKVINAG